MRRLDGTSAFMFYCDGPRNYQHTLKISIIDLPEGKQKLDFDAYLAGLEERLKAAPYMRWKLVQAPFGIHHPYWIEDLEFDLRHHVRRIACPQPGDRKEFCELVSSLYAQPLDRSLPLWKTWVIEGLEGNRVAFVSMLHHAYTDGVGFSHVLNTFMASPPQRRNPTSEELGVDSHKNPSRLRLFVDSSIKLPFFLLAALPRIVSGAIKMRKIKKEYEEAGKILPPDPLTAPPSPLNVVLTPGRTFFYQSFALADFKAVSKFYGVTINELLLAVVTGAIRLFYDSLGESKDTPLISAIPINARPEENKEDILGNYIYSSTVTLPIHLDDKKERLSVIRESSQNMKEYLKATAGANMMDTIAIMPPVVTSLMKWMVKRSGGKQSFAGNLTVSNVPGPTEKLVLHSINAEVEDWLSIGQVTLNMGVNITAWRYVDKINICLLADSTVIPDGEQFFSYMEQAFNEYQQSLTSEEG